MSARNIEVEEFKHALALSAPDYSIDVSDDAIDRLGVYFAMVNKWNPRLHLVAPCSPEVFAKRHVLESTIVLNKLHSGSTVVDVGSGAGLPIIPCLIIRSDLHATLIEASIRKSVFLREVLKETQTSTRALVISERFEDTNCPSVDFITCRALDRFEELLPLLVRWASKPTTLLLFGGENLQDRLEDLSLQHSRVRIPNSEKRFLYEVPFGVR